jgi:hypothetical protein
MQHIRQAFSITFLAFALSLQAQLDTSWLSLGSFVKANKPKSFSIKANTSIASSGLNSGMMVDFLTKPTFSPKALNRYNSSDTKSTNVFYNTNLKLNYILNKNWEVGLHASDLIYYQASTSLSQLLLNGNKEYLDRNIASSNLHLQRLSRINVSVFNRFELRKQTLRLNYGLSTMPRYTRLQAKDVDLFSSTDSVTLTTASNAYTRLLSPGVGLQLGLSLYGSLKNEHTYAIQISEANIYYTSNSEITSWTNNVAFSGIRFQPGSSFNDAVEKELSNTLSLVKEKRSLLVVLPALEGSYRIPFKASSLSFNAYSFYSMFAVSSCWHKPVGTNYLINMGLDGGNFQAIRARTGIEFKAKKASVMLNVLGVNSLITQSLPGGFGAEFGFTVHP